MLAAATPPNPCKPPISHTGAGNLGIGIGIGIDGSVTVPNKCDVLSNGILHVDPGHFPVSRFGAPNATSTPVDFSISLSDYAASAKPTLSFRDKAAQPNADKTPLSSSAPAARAVAQGFNLVTTEASTGEWIAYGDPVSARQYPMKRMGDMATIPLRAQDIRTGAAELTFTFP